MSTALHRAFDGLTVLVTGHTGFKGSWLSIWLRELGARVVGYSLDPPTEPSNFALTRLADRMIDERGDVRDLEHLIQVVGRHAPQVVFHLAAQPLVLPSYEDPVETFGTNVMGTVHLLEAVRHVPSVRAAVCITTDKVYHNQEWPWGYREIDPLGGHDPYAASKAMAELAVSAYRQSFFARDACGEGVIDAPRRTAHAAAIASARAGNVIGGGDWSAHRLVPDCIRALEAGGPISLRNPTHIRPWQLLLEPLSGYLWLAACMLAEDGACYAEAWNFGPRETGICTEEVVQRIIHLWGTGTYRAVSAEATAAEAPVETARLCLNWDKAAARLDWAPVYDWQQAIAETVRWYREYAKQRKHSDGISIDMYATCVEQITAYTRRAQEQDQPWAH